MKAMFGTRPMGRLVLHLGAPKCGSSALQAALTHNPDHYDRAGQRYCYVGTRTTGGIVHPLYGRKVKRVAQLSEFGYASWPNLRDPDQSYVGVARVIVPKGAQSDPDPVWAALDQVMQASKRRAHVPILSNEGWLREAAAFADWLKGHPKAVVDAVAFVRPPVDWVNAAYWQWGVWTGLDCVTWMRRSGMRYQLGA